jgi:hypothetical protein
MSAEKDTRESNKQRIEDNQDLEETYQPPEQPERPIGRWIASFKRRRDDRSAKRPIEKATRDRMRPVLLGVLAVAVVVVILLGLFSSPLSKKRQQEVAEHRTPNLGRPLVPDPSRSQPDGADRSVTPLLGIDVQSQSDSSRSLVTESDLQGSRTRNPMHTADPRSMQTSPAPAPISPTPPAQSLSRAGVSGTTSSPYELRQTEFSDAAGRRRESLAEVESRIAHLELQAHTREARSTRPPISDSLAKPSLVYVHNPTTGPATATPRPLSGELEAQDSHLPFDLPTGMRLLARLQSTITTAVVTPVVAMIEYNYERNGEIVVPAGSKVFGKLEQADRSGHVGVKFDTIQRPHGTTYKIEGVAQGLDSGPLRGRVEGKKNVTRFLSRAATGLGVVASQAVGLRGGINGPISNGVLIRDRLANNIAQAGDQQMQQLALSTNIRVTVPSNIRFYVVLQKPVGMMANAKVSHELASSSSGLPGYPTDSAPLTRAELEELRNLKAEFKRLMQVAGGQAPAAEATASSK